MMADVFLEYFPTRKLDHRPIIQNKLLVHQQMYCRKSMQPRRMPSGRGWARLRCMKGKGRDNLTNTSPTSSSISMNSSVLTNTENTKEQKPPLLMSGLSSHLVPIAIIMNKFRKSVLNLTNGPRNEPSLPIAVITKEHRFWLRYSERVFGILRHVTTVHECRTCM